MTETAILIEEIFLMTDLIGAFYSGSANIFLNLYMQYTYTYIFAVEFCDFMSFDGM